jgi:hypothetical protein
MVYRRKGSGKPSSSEEPSRSDEPPSSRGADREPGGNDGALRRDSSPANSRFGKRKTEVSGSGSADGKAAALRDSEQASSRTPSAQYGVCGPKGSGEPPSTRCGICGHRTFLVGLPGRTEKYCYECSADMATSLLLTTEIDAATLAGQDANALIAEFELLSSRLLARAQSA